MCVSMCRGVEYSLDRDYEKRKSSLYDPVVLIISALKLLITLLDVLILNSFDFLTRKKKITYSPFYFLFLLYFYFLFLVILELQSEILYNYHRQLWFMMDFDYVYV